MNIGIDIDFTITFSEESAAFFSLITNLLKGNAKIFIITNRGTDNKEKTEKELSELNIYYDELVITAKKAEYIIENDVSVYFEDTDEYFLNLPPEITVFKIREYGNFDFIHHKWIYDKKSGYNINELV